MKELLELLPSLILLIFSMGSLIITNGSKIVVPEGTALITMQDGAITGMVAEPGGFIYTSEDPNSKSLFSGGGILASTIGQSWERFKFGGITISSSVVSVSSVTS